MDRIRQHRHGAAGQGDDQLQARGETQDQQRDLDRADPLGRANHGAIHGVGRVMRVWRQEVPQPVPGAAAAVVMSVIVIVIVVLDR